MRSTALLPRSEGSSTRYLAPGGSLPPVLFRVGWQTPGIGLTWGFTGNAHLGPHPVLADPESLFYQDASPASLISFQFIYWKEQNDRDLSFASSLPSSQGWERVRSNV